jgi:DNA polymerase-1
MEKPRLVLFDGHHLVHRAFHALPPLTVRRTGETVGAVYGFCLILLKAINDLNPTHYAIAFDRPGPTFRHEMFDQYKAHRPKPPDELIQQLGRVRELVEAFNIPIFEMDGYEADDVLGALTGQASEQDVDTIIVTGDRDALQLVSPHVRVLAPAGRGFGDTALFDEGEVEAKYGIRPENVADLKALEGDQSDNIPGVPGIGRKTAVKLIQQFGGIDRIYEHIDEVTPARLQGLLRENEAIARQSRELATIVIETPVTLDLELCRTSNYDRAKAADLLRELEFNSLLEKLPEDGETAGAAAEVVSQPPVPIDYHTVVTEEDLDHLLERLSGAAAIAFDLETTGLDTMRDVPVGISISPAPGEAYYVPVGHVGWGHVEQLPMDYVLDRLRPLFEDERVPKVGHNGKFDVMMLAEQGVRVNNLASDTMIAAHLLNESSLGLKSLAFQRLAVEMTPITDLIGTGAKQISMSQVSIEEAADYACADADMTSRLNDVLAPELHREELWQLYSEVEMPLVPVLVHMERSGITLDTDLLAGMSRRYGEQLSTIEGDIYESVGHQFNINSPKQLGSVLFEEIELPTARRKGGTYSTAAPVLEALRDVHPVVGLVLDYRQLSKLKSTYIDALPTLVNQKTGRVHTSFNQTRTATGRLSSSDPNLQNIPVRGSEARQIREAFIAPPGCLLLSADYSQIDLRSLAHLSQDEALLAAFRHDDDIHSATAARLYGVALNEVTADMRRLAKTVNFGVIYGMSEFGLQQAAELSREEAAGFIEAYFERYPGIRQYLESTKEQARRQGYVETMLRRKRTIAEINSSNRQVREGAERMAINMPVQGTSADIIKVAMVNVYREMGRRGLASRMLLQVHDELMFEVPEGEIDEMLEMVPRLMSTALELSVPLKVDTKTGRTWGGME